MPLVQSSNQDGLGSSIIAGEGVAGTPTGGVVSIQQTFGPPTNLDKAGTGSISALNGAVVATTNGASTAYFNITGTWVATLLFEGQDGNGLWMDCLGTVPGNGSATGSTGTNLALDVPCGGFNQVRVRASAYTSGTVTVNYNVGTGISSVQVFNLTPSALQATVTGSGTAGTPATGVVSVQGVASGTPIQENLTQIAGNTVNAGAGATGTGTLRVAANTYDGSGNTIASINSQLETRDVLNTSSQYRAQSVTTAAAQALGGATILANRKLISITPTNGIIYWGTNSSVTTTTGSPLFPNNTLFLSCTDNSQVWVIGVATTDVRIAEFS